MNSVTVLKEQSLASLLPVEYEIFYTIAAIRTTGQKEITFSELNKELNQRRHKSGNAKRLSKQAMTHHLAKLCKRSFMLKRTALPNTFYSFKNGLYKLNQAPPLCIMIGDAKTKVMLCSLIKECGFSPLTKECLEKLALSKAS